MPPIDVLVVGAGPAGLAAAIRLRQRLPDAAVVVIDKAAAPGFHNLSGAIFEPAVLDELLPDWRDDRSRFAEQVTPVERDELCFLTGAHAARLPAALVPRALRHDGDVTLSVSKLTAFLADRAERLGAELHHGFAARSLLVEDGVVRGVRLADAGLDADGRPKDNYLAGEEIRAPVTLLTDGSRGVLSTRLAELVGGRGSGLDGHRDPQTYGLGVKALVQFAKESPFGSGRVVHTLGYPAGHDLFGGGFLYSMGPRTVAVGLILGLDWRWGDLDPRAEFERFRAHPFIAGLLEGGTTVATGAKTIPSGGYYALGPLAAPGALVAGDAAGFVNEARLKGLHYAMRSGMLAAEAIADTLLSGERSGPNAAAAGYAHGLAERGLLDELRGARNYRQGFQWGLVPGAALSFVGGHLPLHLRMRGDAEATRRAARLAGEPRQPVDGAAFVSLTGTAHREDEPAHVTLVDPSRCERCDTAYAAACTHFCPGEVYRWSDGHLVISPSNCLHCMTCAVKCPEANIRWTVPEGGEGPRYRLV